VVTKASVSQCTFVKLQQPRLPRWDTTEVSLHGRRGQPTVATATSLPLGRATAAAATGASVTAQVALLAAVSRGTADPPGQRLAWQLDQGSECGRHAGAPVTKATLPCWGLRHSESLGASGSSRGCQGSSIWEWVCRRLAHAPRAKPCARRAWSEGLLQ